MNNTPSPEAGALEAARAVAIECDPLFETLYDHEIEKIGRAYHEAYIAARAPLSAPEVGGLEERALTAAIGSCNCRTKTPELDAHALYCRFRVIEELATALAAMQSEHARAITRINDEAVSKIATLTRERNAALAEAGRLREALSRASQAMQSVGVFITSREQIKKPEGHEWWAAEIAAVRARLSTTPPETGGK